MILMLAAGSVVDLQVNNVKRCLHLAKTVFKPVWILARRTLPSSLLKSWPLRVEKCAPTILEPWGGFPGPPPAFLQGLQAAMSQRKKLYKSKGRFYYLCPQSTRLG
jgi:hypothetical protein